MLTKQSLEGYAEYEQLVGGVETLFKTNADTVMNYANNAYKTAGLSANQYMETVTGFSASLLQSLDGDTQKAAHTADMAITDMADNANKMGSSMESIQNAYQGFAKQNYTMLDNLKLGYGGTKEEMQRLLEDAEKLSGIKYDISSFSDIADAIHVIQGEMEISGRTAEEAADIYERTGRRVSEQMGTTAKEASTTIQGSIASMKSAWKNLVVGIADNTQNLDGLINNFVESTSTAANNIIPRIEQILSGVGQLITKLAPVIAQALPDLITRVLPPLLSAGAQMLDGIIKGLISALPALTASAVQILKMLTDALIANLPALVDAALQIIVALANAITEALPELVPAIVEITMKIVEVLIENLPALIEAGVQIVGGLIVGLIKAIPELLKAIPKVVKALIDGFCSLLGIHSPSTVFAEIGNNLIAGLLKGVSDTWRSIVDFFKGAVESLTNFFSSAWATIKNGVSVAWDAIAGVFESAWENIKKAWDGVTEFFSKIWEGIKGVFSKASEVLGGFFSDAWKAIQSAWSAVVEFFSGIGEGIKETFSAVTEAVSGFFSNTWNSIKDIWGSVVGFFSSVGEGISNVFSTVTEFLSNAFSNAWEAIQNVWNSVVDYFSNIWQGITGVFASVANWFRDKFTEARESVKSVWSNIKDFFSQKKSDILGVFSNIGSKFLEIGRNIVNGIKNGVANAWNSFVSFITSKISGVVSSVKNLLGIHSPSTVFAGIGSNMVLGIKVGWDDEYSGLKRQIENGMDFGTATVGLSASGLRTGNSDFGSSNGQWGSLQGGNTVNVTINSPVAIDAIQAAREWKKTTQRMALSYV